MQCKFKEGENLGEETDKFNEHDWEVLNSLFFTCQCKHCGIKYIKIHYD